MRRQQGRKAYVLLSDGVDVHSKATIVTAIEYAQRADTIIYSILFAQRSWLRYYPSTAPIVRVYEARGTHDMQRLARETGGTYYEVSKRNSIERIYASIEEQLRNQYSIGYTPERKDAGRRYCQIRLTARRPGSRNILKVSNAVASTSARETNLPVLSSYSTRARLASKTCAPPAPLDIGANREAQNRLHLESQARLKLPARRGSASFGPTPRLLCESRSGLAHRG
jgi:hypothetical protein